MSPRISVLLPTYRYGRFLSEAVESVLTQDEPRFELLISDDASDDGTAEQARAIAARDPRIRVWIQPRNLGMVGNWNFLLREARGTYIKFVFGDDRLQSPSALRRMAERLDRDSEVELVSSARTLIDESSATVGRINELGADGAFAGDSMITRCLVEECNLIGEPTAVMFRRASGTRGFDPNLKQYVDLEMWMHLLRGGSLSHCAEELAAFRQHPGQATAANARGRAASVDFCILLSRYHGHFVAPQWGVDPRSSGYRRRLFRQIYYSRKARRRPKEGVLAEFDLMDRLTRGRYFSLWLQHRLTKPFENLRRHRAET